MSDHVQFVRVERVSTHAPIAWDAYDYEGRYYYLRHRHGTGRIESEHGFVHFKHELPDEATTNEQLLNAFLDLCNAAGDTRWSLYDPCHVADYDYAQEQRRMDAAYDQMTSSPNAELGLMQRLTAPAVVEAAPPPQPLFKGRVAIFMAPDESLVISYRRDGETEQKQTVIPGMYLAMAASTVGANPQDMLQKVMGL